MWDLHKIVAAITSKEKVEPKDIEKTILLLTDESMLDDLPTLRRIVRKLNAIMEYEDGKVT